MKQNVCDGSGEKPEEQHEILASVHRFLADEGAMQTTQNSPALASVDPGSFDAIFLPGGHGPMWDAANDETLARIVGTMFDQGKMGSAQGLCNKPRQTGQSRNIEGDGQDWPPSPLTLWTAANQDSAPRSHRSHTPVPDPRRPFNHRNACSPIVASRWITRPCSAGFRLVLQNWTSASVHIYG